MPPETSSDNTTQADTSSLQRNNFNVLRLLFAVMVVFSHSPQFVDGDKRREPLWLFSRHQTDMGTLAVYGFFIISGYLLVQSWQRSRSPGDFLRKRVLRIYPGFIIAFLFSVFVAGGLGVSHAAAYYAHLSYPKLLVHLLMLRKPATPPVFDGIPYAHVNGAVWTIQYEFICYLILMVLGIAGLLKRRQFAFLAFLLCYSLNFIGQHWQLGGKYNTRFDGWMMNPMILTSVATYFFAGVCAYVFREHFPRKPAWAIVSVILLLVAWRTKDAFLVMPLAGTYLLMLAGQSRSEWLAKIGYDKDKTDLSYGLYLYAWPIQMLVLWHWRSLSPWLLFAISTAIASVLALFSWRFVERPCLKLKARTSSASPAAQAEAG